MMTPRPETPPGYAVVVDAGAHGCRWIVKRANGPTLSGPAPDADSARRRGVFAAGALGALQRVGQRGF
jgi:hypothetical protein